MLPSSHDAVWFVCVCATRISLSTQNTMLTILNALSLACAESSIGSMQVGFLMALAGVPVRELFNHVEYWWRKRVSHASQLELFTITLLATWPVSVNYQLWPVGKSVFFGRYFCTVSFGGNTL